MFSSPAFDRCLFLGGDCLGVLLMPYHVDELTVVATSSKT